MQTKKTRSVFWVASTHAITTGFALPLVLSVIALVALRALQLSPTAIFFLLLPVEALGYVGGVFYSVSYLRRTTIIEKPAACVKPSIIMFIVLAILGLAANVYGLLTDKPAGVNPMIGIGSLAVFEVVICFLFARLTRRAFSQMEPQTAAQ